jgi:hypothetical protein
LPTSVNIGPVLDGHQWGSSNFRYRDVIFSYVYNSAAGVGVNDFVNAVEGTNYIGFRFDSGAGRQYGWAQFDIDLTPGAFSVTIAQWTYSDTPGEYVHIGTVGNAVASISEPGTTILPAIALLGMGAMGVRRWREQRKAIAVPTAQ